VGFVAYLTSLVLFCCNSEFFAVISAFVEALVVFYSSLFSFSCNLHVELFITGSPGIPKFLGYGVLSPFVDHSEAISLVLLLGKDVSKNVVILWDHERLFQGVVVRGIEITVGSFVHLVRYICHLHGFIELAWRVTLVVFCYDISPVEVKSMLGFIF